MAHAKVSAIDAEILRKAFQAAIAEGKIPEDRGREHAALLISTYKGSDEVDPEVSGLDCAEVALLTRRGAGSRDV